MTSRSRNRRTVSIADDDRARIPFAMIAVLLLVSSIAIVATLEQRSDPVIEQDVEVVMDRSETAAQSELRSAAIDANHDVVSAPLINASSADTDITAIGPNNDQPVNLENYLKLRIYLEAHDRLPAAGQRVGSETVSTVSIPPVTADGDNGVSPDEAIDAVDLTIGDDSATALEAGLLEVTLHDVEVDAETGGRNLPAETRDLSVTVGSPVMQLNERTSTYESRLNEGFLDAGIDTELESLGQHMAARLYPFAYFKSGWDRMHKTASPESHDFGRVLEPGHTEVLTNHAIFAIQEDVFGTRDPYAQRTLRPGYVCMAYQMGESMSGGSDDSGESGDSSIIDTDEFGMGEVTNETQDNESVDIETQLCDGGAVQQWIFGDQATGELPDMPPLSELIQEGLGEMDVMNEAEEIPIADLSEASYRYYQYQVLHDKTMDVTEFFEDRTDAVVDQVPDEYRDDVEETVDQAGTPDIENDGRSIQRLMEELYEIDIDTSGGNARLLGHTPSAGPQPTQNHSLGTFSVDISDVRDTDVTHEAFPHPDGTSASSDRTIHELDVDAELELDAIEMWIHDDPVNASEYGERETVTRTETANVSARLGLSIEGQYDFREEGLYDDTFVIQEEPALESDYLPLQLPARDSNTSSTQSQSQSRSRSENGTGMAGGASALQSTGSLGNETTFNAALIDSVLDVTDGVSYYGSVERDLEQNVDALQSRTTDFGSDSGTTKTGAIESAFEEAVIDDEFDETYELDELVAVTEQYGLETDLYNELNRTHTEFSTWIEDEENAYTVNRTELLNADANPVSGAIDHVKAVEDEFVYRNLSASGPNDSFETPEEFLTAQVRKAYFDRLYSYLDVVAGQYEGRVGDIEDEVDEMGEPAVDVGDDLLGFVQDVLNADVEYNPESIKGSPVLDDAQYEVAGSPTYLTHENISGTQDPAVRPANATITDVDAETEHAPLTIQSTNRNRWPGLPVIPTPPSMWLLQANTWNTTIRGEYARFEVGATISDPGETGRLTYVREHRPITVELHDGTELELGTNEPIEFESTTEVIVVMPGAVVSSGGVPAVGDTEPEHNGQTVCSPTWDQTGPGFDPDEAEATIERECAYPSAGG
ncbi:hypothetical protein [Natrialba sp. PRR66]|uniref:DUF7286 family protein n=1 Tax=Natrialba sp. PRR66 TaxID=3098146 RepID=UPI002B1DC0D4|nr:hypothetical protein [Natrialba sp. PRR66]